MAHNVPISPLGGEIRARTPFKGRSGDVREAALTLFAERGYHGTTMNDIAGALGIRAPSLYNHISSKQEILREIITDTMDQVLADFEAATAGVNDVADRLRCATEVYVLRHAQHRREALIVNRETQSLEPPARSTARAKQDEYARRFRDLIEEGRAAGRFHVKSPRLAMFAILEMAVTVARWFRDEGPLSAREVAEEYGEFALRIVGFSESSCKAGLDH